ncbi:thermonuclease family protein [Pseudomonas gingeri]|uniref:Thermonuclease family protein n=1 Tax=Pseudomonas gingeri TaxID=117681 RepID=A0A7Y7YFK4_9PSED|nr:thermonuclease family protein [Pseudomonas gingeri]NWB31714.1 thermonuclease family protein [Pseudomonas gingeri]NWC34964.1 thermonuclease family protein [Pseudomonas gingeri]NWD05782.1 thermonuclease family protein [Pseudomonas gingeri]NWD46677.1 thermonuclease family protein [Pseudomonas gingeri]NWE31228.1 thermonuclease family protein [Pseudomonas gingeri]
MLMKKALLVSAFFVGAIWQVPALASCPALPGALRVEVQRVIDGDTVRLKDGRSVRLIGVNAPELGRKGRAAEPFAEAARRRLQSLVMENDGQVGLVTGRERRDRYGRTLAHLYGREGVNLEARLLAEGLAYQVVIAPNDNLFECQQLAERQARQLGLGLWRRPSVLKADQIRKPGFALLTGRVNNIRRNRGGLWIELQGAVVLHVAADRLERFDSAWISRLKGRQVEARGWVVGRSGRGPLRKRGSRWLLSLDHPGMLQVAR